MSQKLESILRKIFLSSLAALNAGQDNLAAPNESTTFVDPETKSQDISPKLKNLERKILLKLTSAGDFDYRFHRSHRSHSSHHSHYSSSSGSSGSGSSGSSSSSSNASSGSSNNSSLGLYGKTNSRSTRSTYKTKKSSTNKSRLRLSVTRNLGDRILEIGMFGQDVTALINIMIRKKYLELEDGETFLTGSQTFDEIVEEAVKLFQKDNSLKETGIVDPLTLIYLKK